MQVINLGSRMFLSSFFFFHDLQIMASVASMFLFSQILGCNPIEKMIYR